MSNKPPAWELYLLADGQAKVTMAMDTKVPNAATFTIQKEDHTLANLLRSYVMQLKTHHETTLKESIRHFRRIQDATSSGAALFVKDSDHTRYKSKGSIAQGN